MGRRRAAIGVTAAASVAVAGWLGWTNNRGRARTSFDYPFVPSIAHADGSLTPVPCTDGSTVIPWKVPSREDQLKKLKEGKKFDLVVIGGGATGSGVALDAANRGLKVALIEQSDFGAGTSGRSTKLIHGGIRYLENAFKKMDYGLYQLVEEALHEREHMINSAPYMAQPLPIMVPIYNWWQIPYIYTGVKLYDFIAGRSKAVPPSRYISKAEALHQFPMLKEEGLSGAIVYYDGQHNDARMNLNIVLTALQHGAAMGNYIEVEGLQKDGEGKVTGVKVKDTIDGSAWTINTRAVVNATGPFVDNIRKMDNPDVKPIIVPAAGVHVILPDHFCPEHMGLIVPETSDGRVLFFLPWEGTTICGTTDSKTESTMLPEPSVEEVDFILEESNRYLDKKVSHKDVLAAWSGIRPLAMDPKRMKEGAGTSAISREHVIETSPSGIVTITGGKWTTYRQMAEDTVNKVLDVNSKLKPMYGCRTKGVQLIGSDRRGIVCGQKFDVVAVQLRDQYDMDKALAVHLTRSYGTRALQVAEIAKAEKAFKRLHHKYPYIEAEVKFAVRQELAVTVEDILARRTRLAYLDEKAAEEALPKVLEVMAKELKWSSKRKAQEAKRMQAFLKTMRPQFQDS
uniref:Glycerol-3-phosphate dehydrogenase n=1 Tax=Palpitomonas bilix TaxID=652834 RepID=A0A7S3GJL0_9EUKA|mmetsp:Transcript_6168/g.15264  ORF Transcript_6168/g.15264 Transcript_6168/m.15264 type:complete len:625 (+) Transcript_6168:36-1910(+)